MDPDNNLSITGKIFDVEASLQGILFAVFFLMQGIYAGEAQFISGDYVLPFWLFTVTGSLIILGGVIMGVAFSHVCSKIPPTENKLWWVVTLFRCKLGTLFFVIPLVSLVSILGR